MGIKDDQANEAHFRNFAKTLERAIARYGDLSEEDVTSRQKRQLETLVDLEQSFRQQLVDCDEGIHVYEKFIAFIRDDRRNILDARPFFRERYEVFVEEISPAFKSRDVQAMTKFGFNYQFVKFALDNGNWSKLGKIGKSVIKTGRQIRDIRNELAEMNMPLAINRAKLFWSRTQKSHLEYMDMVQTASEGLMSAIDKYVLPYSTVFRSVIIGRIVGNLIESYSSTMLHFYPSDKRKLYRANKAVGRQTPEDVDINKLVSFVNEGGILTDTIEIRNLMAAASCVSADTTPVSHSSSEEDGSVRSVDSFEAPESARPDVAYEEAEATHAVANAIQALPMLDQKLLRLKGISF